MKSMKKLILLSGAMMLFTTSLSIASPNEGMKRKGGVERSERMKISESVREQYRTLYETKEFDEALAREIAEGQVERQIERMRLKHQRIQEAGGKWEPKKERKALYDKHKKMYNERGEKRREMKRDERGKESPRRGEVKVSESEIVEE